MSLRLLAILAALLVSAPSVAFATEPGTVDERELDRRLAFLEHRIGIEKAHAEGWWWGWTTFEIFGMTVQSVRGATAVNKSDRVADWVSAVQSAIGVTAFLIRPEANIRGLAPSSRGKLTHEEKLARVRYAESVLEANAKQTHPFGLWYAHLINVGLNTAGFVIIGAVSHDWKQATLSGVMGVSFGEAELVTQPWEADFDLEAYHRKFGGTVGGSPIVPKQKSSIEWRLAPAPGGLGFGASF